MKTRHALFLFPIFLSFFGLVILFKIIQPVQAVHPFAFSPEPNGYPLTYKLRELLADTPSFPSGVNFGTGGDATWAVAVGDMDGDGDLDIVTGNFNQQHVVYLNDGAGNFLSGVNFGTGGRATASIAVGDMDGDSDLDIVVGNFYQQNVVYLNDGTGSFLTAINFGTGGDATASVVVGDMDGDGDLDIVTGNYNQQNVVYLNNEAGSFSTGVNFGTGGDATRGLAVGDMDGDGDLDIVTGNYNQQNVVYLNNEAGNFSTGVNFGTGEDATWSVAVGDMDSDGDLDILTGNYEQQNVVYLNDGAGNFPTSVNFGTGGDATASIAVGDMDSDGDLDIVTGNYSQSNVVYLNDGTGNFMAGVNFGTGGDNTRSVAVGDLDSDGDLDIVTGNYNQQNVVYLNNGAGNFSTSVNFGSGGEATRGLAVGDMDGDGDLDLVTGNEIEQNVLYLNNGAGSFSTGVNFGTGGDATRGLAVGDMDSDGDLDIVTGNYNQQNVVYLNNGAGNFSTGVNFGTGEDHTASVALGDMDSDGDLDIVTGNYNQPNVVYLNDGTGNFMAGVNFGTGGDNTRSVAVGDLDSDGDLDIVTGNYNQPNVVYLNNGAGNFSTSVNFGTGGDNTTSVAVGDVDGDRDLDLVAGNEFEPNVVYLNNGAGNFLTSVNFDTGAHNTRSVAVGDVDGDLDLDIVAGSYNQQNVVYLNDGASFPTGVSVGTGEDNTTSMAVGDTDGDGDLDLVIGNEFEQNVVYLNTLHKPTLLPQNPPQATVKRPGTVALANFFHTPQILESPTISITYTLFDPESDPVRFIRAYYSINGSGGWLPAIAASSTITTDLPTAPYPTTNSTNTHVFVWDTFASGFFGQSDHVVFRLEAYPTLQTAPSSTPIYMYPYTSSTTFPFRVRGTQVRVYTDTIATGNELANAMVYRLPNGDTNEGIPLTDGSGHPFRTDQNGYLQGKGEIFPGDRLMALFPITATESYTLYYTSATPTLTGLEMYTVTQFGIQELVISPDHPLILFNLKVSLEWDARNDPIFLDQLALDLQRASELLFDWSNGQSALGKITIYHDREQWNAADIRIYASNRLHPNAIIGGVVSEVLTETSPLTPSEVITYTPGEVRMAAIWNRYGDPGSNLGEDWPRALAHELGHYLFFLNDNYLGLDENDLLVSVSTCTGVMSDPYTDDDDSGYDEFHLEQNWLPTCENTLANLETGRADWTTLAYFYPWLSETNNSGPNGLPLAVTQITYLEPITPTTTLNFSLFGLQKEEGGIYQATAQARAFLFQGFTLTDLGRPVLDQVNARGASPGDQLCVYDLPAERLGCETISALNQQLSMTSLPGWQPEVILTPVTSNTLYIRVTIPGLPENSVVQARLYPSDYAAAEVISLSETVTDVYTGAYIELSNPAIEGYVHIWVDEPAPRREVITDFSLGGYPGPKPRGAGGLAPMISPDGQVILYGQDLEFPKGEFYAFQTATILPYEIPWGTVIGQAYYLLASDGAPAFVNTSIRFSYLGSEVPPGEETFLRIYFWEEGAGWTPLDTQVDTYQNSAVAQVREEPGLYALMSSIEIPLYGPGWNLIGYPVLDTRPVTETLASIDGRYSKVCRYDASDLDDPWKCFGSDVPAWVNDLTAMEFGWGYWIYISDAGPLTLRLKGNGLDATMPDEPDAFENPPATYYGLALQTEDFMPQQGMLVTAWVDGKLCGQANTLNLYDQIVFVIDVFAFGTGDTDGCGLPGKAITFRVNGQMMTPIVLWDDRWIWETALSPGFQYYLPFVNRQ